MCGFLPFNNVRNANLVTQNQFIFFLVYMESQSISASTNDGTLHIRFLNFEGPTSKVLSLLSNGSQPSVYKRKVLPILQAL
jgi:hypothetical protein